MQIRWTADDRAIPVDGDEVQVSRGDRVDLPIEHARSLIAQGLAEHDKPKPKPAPAKKAAPEAPAVNEKESSDGNG